MTQKNIIKGLKIALFVVLAIFVVGYIFMLLWNWLMPEIFGLSEITWHQAIGLIILSKIIFGFGKGGPKKCCSNKMKNHFGWKEKMKERYANMSDEEKEKLKNKCGGWLNSDDNDCC